MYQLLFYIPFRNAWVTGATCICGSCQCFSSNSPLLVNLKSSILMYYLLFCVPFRNAWVTGATCVCGSCQCFSSNSPLLVNLQIFYIDILLLCVPFRNAWVTGATCVCGSCWCCSSYSPWGWCCSSSTGALTGGSVCSRCDARSLSPTPSCSRYSNLVTL